MADCNEEKKLPDTSWKVKCLSPAMEVIKRRQFYLIQKFSSLLIKSTLFMKKGKMIVSALALVVALGSAFAFKAKTGPGNLWYYNSDYACVQAPCSTFDGGPATPCPIPPPELPTHQEGLYGDEGCRYPWVNEAWVTDGGQ
jgi:hypothetical protein